MTNAALAHAPSVAQRPMVKIYPGQPTSDGAGVNLTRMLGAQALPDLDPFLMLDQIRSDDSGDYIAGFPDHPHRGFETVTIMLDGRMRHWDNKGNSGVIGPGDVQWMTAGRGLIHSEIPEQDEGRLWGFQLWVNLPANRKMTAPRYQEIHAADIPHDDGDGVSIRVIAGRRASGVKGPATSAGGDPLLFDIRLDPGAQVDEPIPAGHTAFIAVYQGDVSGVDAHGRVQSVSDPNLAVLGDGETVGLAAGKNGARFLLIAAPPLNEPVARYGPFVMNTRAQLEQAFADFQQGRF